VNEHPHPAPAPTPAEFERIRRILERAVRRVCPSWLASQSEDLVQNACLRVVQKWKNTEEPAALGSSYLWKVAHSAVMDEIRHRRRHREVAMDDPGTAEPASAAPSPEQTSSATELRRSIEAGVRKLKESRRSAVLLYLYGFSLQESARSLGWTTKRVDNQRYQGLAELRAYLQRRGFEP
jgi:RNA polymerase sigma-70 factor (ECF subfamily)